MSEHTPGPWSAGTDCVFADGLKRVVCTTWGVGGPTDRPENDANTRLIAVAPDLYEYVESCASAGCATAKKLMERINGHS